MSNLIERAKMVVPREELRSYFVAHNILDRAGMVAVTEIATLMADFAQSEIEKIDERLHHANKIIALLAKYYPLAEDAISFELMEYVRKYPDVVSDSDRAL